MFAAGSVGTGDRGDEDYSGICKSEGGEVYYPEAVHADHLSENLGPAAGRRQSQNRHEKNACKRRKCLRRGLRDLISGILGNISAVGGGCFYRCAGVNTLRIKKGER